jgi:hypothetical protein
MKWALPPENNPAGGFRCPALRQKFQIPIRPHLDPYMDHLVGSEPPKSSHQCHSST